MALPSGLRTGKTHVSKTLYSKGSAKHFLSTSSTQHMGAVSCELRQFSQDMRREVGSWVGVCVPRALSLSFENSEQNFSTA